MKGFGSVAVKFLGLWAALVCATVAAGLIPPQITHPGEADGPLGGIAALLVVNALDALVLTALAVRLTVAGWMRPAILFLVLFALDTGLSWIEAMFFADFLQLSELSLFGMAADGLIRSVAGAATAALLWRRVAEEGLQLAVALAPLALLPGVYILLYFAAGAAVGWSNPAVRAYYENGLGIDLAELVVLQLGRGAIWASLAAVLAVTIRGPTRVVAALVGTVFAVLMTSPLLYPSAIMPWPVRQAHMVELVVVNLTFGILAVLILRRRPAP